jgi:hypothetical protein
MPRKKKTDAEKPPEKTEAAPMKTEPFTRDLRVTLKAEEIAERADRAAQILADRDSKEEELKAHAKHAKSVIESLEAEMRRLSNEVRTKATYQEVRCERRFLYDTGKVIEVRLDTGEVLSERDMNDSEKQRDLFDGNGSGLEDEFSGGGEAAQ